MKRTASTLAGLVVVAAILTGCTGTPEPTFTPGTPTPTETSAGPTTYDPPADETEAVNAAEDTIEQLLIVQGEVHAAGGTDTSRYEDLATGKALDRYNANAQRIAKGPLANEDGVNVEGQATTEGRIQFEVETAYGQEFNGTANGLVIVPGCMDISDYKITTADGKPGARPDSDRNKVEFQVTYDTERKLWLVSDLLDFTGQTC